MFKRTVCFFAALLLLALCACSAPKTPEQTAAPAATDEPQSASDPVAADNPVPSPEADETETYPDPEQGDPAATPEAPALTFDEAALAGLPEREEYLRLHEQNAQVLGWITVPNTKINYAVALGTDNDYYLSHTLEGEDSKSGAIFFDYRTDGALSCRHLIVYGHNMRAGTMFHDLGSYKYKDFFENNRIITLWAGSEKRQYEVYAAFIAPRDVYFIREKFQDDQHFLDYMNDLKQRSKFPTDVELSPAGQILTLSTCTYEEPDARFVVQARRVS